MEKIIVIETSRLKNVFIFFQTIFQFHAAKINVLILLQQFLNEVYFHHIHL